MLWMGPQQTCPLYIRELKQQRRATATKTSLKKWSPAYSISFNSSNVGNYFWSWILKDCIEVQEKKTKVVALYSRPPQNVKLGIFTS